jgi:hypothetical protein
VHDPLVDAVVPIVDQVLDPVVDAVVPVVDQVLNPVVEAVVPVVDEVAAPLTDILGDFIGPLGPIMAQTIEPTADQVTELPPSGPLAAADDIFADLDLDNLFAALGQEPEEQAGPSPGLTLVVDADADAQTQDVVSGLGSITFAETPSVDTAVDTLFTGTQYTAYNLALQGSVSAEADAGTAQAPGISIDIGGLISIGTTTDDDDTDNGHPLQLPNVLEDIGLRGLWDS